MDEQAFGRGGRGWVWKGRACVVGMAVCSVPVPLVLVRLRKRGCQHGADKKGKNAVLSHGLPVDVVVVSDCANDCASVRNHQARNMARTPAPQASKAMPVSICSFDW